VGGSWLRLKCAAVTVREGDRSFTEYREFPLIDGCMMQEASEQRGKRLVQLCFLPEALKKSFRVQQSGVSEVWSCRRWPNFRLVLGPILAGWAEVYNQYDGDWRARIWI
jgi:hypothetical protein